MSHRRWPLPGDAPITRARKVALAYRQVAREQADRARDLQQVLVKVDLATITDPRVLTAVTSLLAHGKDDPVQELDERFTDWGETWHAPRPTTFTADDWVFADEAADIIQQSKGSVSRLRRTGRLNGVWIPQQRCFMYKVSDLYTLSSELRARSGAQSGTTDTVSANGKSVTG